MEERYFTEQERIDNMTMKIENDDVQGSGFIKHPPQQRRPAPPDNRSGPNMSYNRRRPYYGQEERGGYGYRPRGRGYRPRPYSPNYGNSFRGPHNSRDSYYRGGPYHESPRPHQARMPYSGYRYGPPGYGGPRGEPDWRNQSAQGPRPGGFPPGMPYRQPQVNARMPLPQQPVQGYHAHADPYAAQRPFGGTPVVPRQSEGRPQQLGQVDPPMTEITKPVPTNATACDGVAEVEQQ